MNVTVGRILSLMKERGIKQGFIADLIGSYSTVVTDWKRGRSAPSQKDLEVLADFFNTPLNYLTGESDDPGHAPEPPESKSCSPKRAACPTPKLEKALEYIQFLKSQRKG
ncbi:MAG: helix-turn-helix domain-containing protein [Ruthenibacterium lactatiformans]